MKQLCGQNHTVSWSVPHKAEWAGDSEQKTSGAEGCSQVTADLGWAQSQMEDTEMELKWQMRSSDSSSRLFVGPRAHYNTMNAPLPPFYLHSRLLFQHPFRRSLLAARRQGVHSGWCMPSLKDTQGSHTNCPKEQTSWRPLPSHPFLVRQLRVTLQSNALLAGRNHPSC